jgi:hypothetical protein
MNRRSFLALLSALPFVGTWIAKPKPTCAIEANIANWPTPTRNFYPTPGLQHFATLPSNITDMITIDGHLVCMCNTGRAYVVREDGTYTEITRPRVDPWEPLTLNGQPIPRPYQDDRFSLRNTRS